MPFKHEIAAMAANALGVTPQEILPLIGKPPKEELGDYALPCFPFAKTMRRSPRDIALMICQADKPAGIERVAEAGGYANFYVDKKAYAEKVLSEALAMGRDYGREDLGQGKAVCIDYSSINIAKPFHIGHLSSTAIGHALYNLYNFMGYKSVGINHLGDWGTQFGKLITAYKLWSSEEEVLKGGIAHMLDLYVRFHAEAEKDPALDDTARAWFVKIEQGDEEALSIFTLFKDMTIREVMGIYDLLGIRFDSYNGESFYNDKMAPVVEELREKGLLKEDKGAYIVDLSEDNMPPCMILKSDGSTLYATRDIAAAFYRKKTYDFAKSLYVVAYQQNLHFRQWFRVVEKMGYPWAKDLEHVAFGMVSLADGGTLSTRKGNVVLLTDVLQSAIDRARVIIEEKSPGLADKDKVAEQVGVGAVVFGVLYNARIKDIAFSYDRALSFEGETAPYMQYTHARCNSVLQKAGENAAQFDYAALDNEYAMGVLKAMVAYKAALPEALSKNEPYLVARAVMEIAKAYNRFYYEVRIIDEADASGTAARLALTRAARDTISRGLDLLGIVAPERM